MGNRNQWGVGALMLLLGGLAQPVWAESGISAQTQMQWIFWGGAAVAILVVLMGIRSLRQSRKAIKQNEK